MITFSRIPLSVIFLLLSFFSIQGAFAKDKPQDLSKAPLEFNSDLYSQIGKEGVWWIKFYSPYCHHCKAFEPTWKTIYKKLNNTYEELNFASINCVSQGDLCDELDIKVYPSVNLYNDGKLVEILKGVQASDYLETFIKGHIEKIRDQKKGPEDAVESESSDETKEKASEPKEKADETKEKTDETKEKADEPKEKADESKEKTKASVVTKPKEKFPAYTGAGDAVNTKYPDSFDPEATETEIDKDAANPKGVSVKLNHKEFTRRVTATRDSWFIQFYSPSAKYSRDIQPAWNQMARKAKGKLNIGQVNCDVEKQFCKQSGIEQFPTLKYFASSLHTEYKGLRGTGDLLLFLKRAIEARDPPSMSYARYKQLRKQTEDVTFLYLYNENTAAEDFQAFEKLCVDGIGTFDVAKSNDTQILDALKETNLPALYAVSKEKVSRFPEMTSTGLRDHNKLQAWAKTHRQPLVPQLTPYNSQDVFLNSVVVLAILDPREEESTAQAIKELRAVAVELDEKRAKASRDELMELRNKKQLKVDEAKDKADEGAEEQAQGIRVEVSEREPISVAWIDSVFWERWIKSRYGAYDGPSRVVINNEKAGKFWDRASNGDVLVPSRSRIIETLEEALAPGSKLKASTFPTGVISYIKGPQVQFLSGRDLMLICGAVVVFTVLYKRHKAKGKMSLGVQSTEGLLGGKVKHQDWKVSLTLILK